MAQPTAMRSSPSRRRRSTTPPARRRSPSPAADAARAWDDALALGENAWLSQCAGHRRRADRHHRPRHGLRHHRHRARFRAGEVQEARRRRLFQDHQPRRARGSARARLSARREIAEIEAYAVGHASLGKAPGGQHRERCARAASPTQNIAKVEAALRERLRHQIRLQQMDARRGFPHRRAEDSRPRSSTSQSFDLLTHLGFSQARDRGRQYPYLRRDDARRRAASEARALCRVRLRQSLRAHRQALSLGRVATSA